MNMGAYGWLAATIVLSVYSQLIMKWRITARFGTLVFPADAWGVGCAWMRVFTDPFVLSGLAATFCSGLCWFLTMRKLPVSHAYPITSAGFVLVVLLSHWLLGESINAWKIVGVCLIVAGIAVASQG